VPADQEHQLAVSVDGTLVHQVGAEHGQRLGLMQVDHALEPGLGAGALRVVVAVAYDDPPPSVGDVLQMNAEDLPRTQATLEHEQHDGAVTESPQLRQQSLDLGLVQRTRHSLDGLDADTATDRLLPAGGTTALTGGDEGGDRATSLPACITYSITHLDPAIRRLLVAVYLFHGVTATDVLAAFWGRRLVSSRIQLSRVPRGCSGE
jgi:hypothetical protein